MGRPSDGVPEQDRAAGPPSTRTLLTTPAAPKSWLRLPNRGPGSLDESLRALEADGDFPAKPGGVFHRRSDRGTWIDYKGREATRIDPGPAGGPPSLGRFHALYYDHIGKKTLVVAGFFSGQVRPWP